MENGYKKLIKLRKKNKYTHKDMADMVGISQGFYSQIEHRKRKLYYEVAIKIANVFNLKPDDLFYEK